MSNKHFWKHLLRVTYFTLSLSHLSSCQSETIFWNTETCIDLDFFQRKQKKCSKAAQHRWYLAQPIKNSSCSHLQNQQSTRHSYWQCGNVLTVGSADTVAVKRNSCLTHTFTEFTLVLSNASADVLFETKIGWPQQPLIPNSNPKGDEQERTEDTLSRYIHWFFHIMNYMYL